MTTLTPTHDQDAPLTVNIAQQLRTRILNGEFAGGTRLIESTLSATFGVSRVPVREALRLLAVQGLVVITPRRGATVCLMGEEQIREMIEVRATLETLNAQLAAQRRSAVQCQTLAALLAEVAVLDMQCQAQLVAVNEQFHRIVDQLAHNTLLQDMMRPLRQRTSMFFGIKDTRQMIRDCHEHVAIGRAIVDGDKELAAILARRHVYSAAGIPVPV